MTYAPLTFALLLTQAFASPQSSDTVRQAPEKGLAEFRQNVQDYIRLRSKAQAAVGPLSSKASPEEIRCSVAALADAIREIRKGAQQGEIFTPEATRWLSTVAQKEIAPVIDPKSEETIEVGNPHLDPEGTNVKLTVNGTYPTSTPVSMMPPRLLQQYPRLPRGLEYRFVGRTLVLHDILANIIVDYAPKVAPPL